jgi:cell division protein FtsW
MDTWRGRWQGRGFGQARETPLNVDLALLCVILALVSIGLVMVYSASIAFDRTWRASHYDGPFHFVMRQGVCAFAGFGAMWLAAQVPMRLLFRFAPLLAAGALGLCVLVTFTSAGMVVNGSKRWLGLYKFAVQPTELLKLMAILFTARFIHKNAAWLSKGESFKQSLLRAHLPLFACFMLLAFVLIRQPDYGSTVVILTVCLTMLFLANWDYRLVLTFVILAALLLAFAILNVKYLKGRFDGYIDPFANEAGSGYQLAHSLYALGRGGIFGVGLGASIEKILYLPEAHTDFIFAVIGEEFGFLGTALMISLFAWVVWRAFAIGQRATMQGQAYLALVAQGIGMWLALQVIINMGVNIGMLPTKGLTLPLISYGGTSLIVSLLTLGVLLRIDRELRWLEQGYQHGLGVQDA